MWGGLIIPQILSLLYFLVTRSELGKIPGPGGFLPIYPVVSALLILLIVGIPLAVFSVRSILNRLSFPPEGAFLATLVGDLIWSLSLPDDSPRRFLLAHLLPRFLQRFQPTILNILNLWLHPPLLA